MAITFASLIGRALLAKRRRHAFLRDQRGVTAIEFGLLALPFFSIIGAILETSVVFLSGQILDSAVQDTSRLIRTGQVQAANYTLDKFRANMCDRLYGLFDCSKLHIEVQVLTAFNATNVKPPVDFNCTTSASCAWQADRPEVYSPGAGSSIVVVQVYYKWPVLLNFGGMTLADLPTGDRVIGAASVFRNEPFS